MLQDLWVPPQSVVPGDHVVHNGRFYKVLASDWTTYKDEHDEVHWDHNRWTLTLEDKGLEDRDGRFEMAFDIFGRVENKPKMLRVRPCGPSRQVEET